MKDDDLERLLGGYEPVGPPASLRARIVGGQTNLRRTWPWAAAAAALLALTVWLHGLTERTVILESVNPSLGSSEDVLTDLMGGGDEARIAARRIVAIDEAARLSAQPVATTGSDGDVR